MGGPGSGRKKGSVNKSKKETGSKKYITSQEKYNKIRRGDREAGRKPSRSTNRNMAKYVRAKMI
jgi:hypothetical protein